MMKKKRYLPAIAAGLILLPTAPSTATTVTPNTVTTGWYDVQMVKRAIVGAYWDQSYSTRAAVCRKWRSNPTARPFVKMALLAYRTVPSVSMREAARGVTQGLNSVCYY